MHPRLVLSIGNFFAAGQFFLILYILTPYLALYMSEAQTGLVIAAGSAVTLGAFFYMGRLVRRFGARKLAIALGFTQAVILSILAVSPGPFIAITLVIFASAIPSLIAYQFDLLLEATMLEDTNTGRVRNLFLTATNLALIVAPLITGALLADSDSYARIFLLAAVCMTPFLALFLLEKLPAIPPPSIRAVRETCICLWADADLRATAFASLVLRFFYGLAPFYVSLYLHTQLGFAWSDLGWVFAVMLLPFVLVMYPVGHIADMWLGDKELMIAGFITLALSFAAVGLITASTPLILIAAILFMTRVGGAVVEATTEAHFFRKISARDANSVGVYRMTSPLASLVAPLIGSALLVTGNYLLFFFVSGGLILVLGVASALAIKDFR